MPLAIRPKTASETTTASGSTRRNTSGSAVYVSSQPNKALALELASLLDRKKRRRRCLTTSAGARAFGVKPAAAIVTAQDFFSKSSALRLKGGTPPRMVLGFVRSVFLTHLNDEKSLDKSFYRSPPHRAKGTGADPLRIATLYHLCRRRDNMTPKKAKESVELALLCAASIAL